ncbi:hypothetical protein [Vulgatibacter incomptus]|nr:hypothetical protein [Vulgatibacter incomptus]
MDPRRLAAPMGRSTNDLDIEAVLHSIERGLEGIHPEWHPVVLVHLGWGIGIRRLRTGDYLERAGLPPALPQGLTQYTLGIRSRQFRQRLSELKVIDSEDVAAWDAVESDAPSDERPIAGWKGIATHLGVSEITAKRWEARGLPVCRPGSGTVLAFPSALNLWVHEGTGATRYAKREFEGDFDPETK